MNRRIAKSALCACVLAAASQWSQWGSAVAGDARLTISVRGATPGVGDIVLAVFSTPKDFLKAPIRTATLPADHHGGAVFTVSGLARGTYAVSAYYDEDKNGELNTGLFGIPRELVGFSNDARALFGPPSFEQARFVFPAIPQLDIQLGRAKD